LAYFAAQGDTDHNSRLAVFVQVVFPDVKQRRCKATVNKSVMSYADVYNMVQFRGLLGKSLQVLLPYFCNEIVTALCLYGAFFGSPKKLEGKKLNNYL
jgi:hypothetical protein